MKKTTALLFLSLILTGFVSLKSDRYITNTIENGRFLASSDKTVTGLVCDVMIRDQDMKVIFDFEKVTKRFITINFVPARDLNRSFGRIKLEASELAPILQGNLKEMNQQTLFDPSSNTTVSFRARGADYQGNPRLQITVESTSLKKLEKMVLKNCAVKENSSYTRY